MAIYNEDIDPNTISKSAEEKQREQLIEQINEIVKEFGEFTIADVEADHSPYVNSKGVLVHLVEEFNEHDCRVRIYDPTSYNSEEIDEYDEDYDNLETSQLEYILELAEQWAEINEE